MCRFFALSLLVILGLGVGGLAGCTGKPTAKPVVIDKDKKPDAHHPGDGHDHSHEGHDHAGHDHAGHDHGHEGHDHATEGKAVTGKAPSDKASTDKASTEKAAPEKATNEKPAIETATPAGDSAATGANTEKNSGGEILGSDDAKDVVLGDPKLTAGIPGEGPLTVEVIQSWLQDPKNHEELTVQLPLGLSAGAGQEKGLSENPLTRAKIELGRQLYFDTRLSVDNTISCASCHHPDFGYAKDTQFGVGVKDQLGGRNSPTSYNRILSDVQFWDGRAGSLEEQAKGPIQNPIEMGNTHENVVQTVKGIEGYRIQFEKIFGDVTIDNIAKAIASFERVIVTGPSPFDYNEVLRAFEGQEEDDIREDMAAWAKFEEAKQFLAKNPMSDSAKRGRELFFGQKANCTACHVGPNLTDEKFHNLGVGMMADKPDLGRSEISKDAKDTGAFKTPTIRNVALTAPYMHDGTQKTLEEVVEWYNKGGHPNPHLSDKIKKLDLTDQEKADLVEFMKACTGEFPKVETGRLPPN
ncbi:MAG: cytochrome c peroxidase [Pirellulales bacterium]|nr:cytochrome c peroxidase [Pirellulales bacterium]